MSLPIDVGQFALATKLPLPLEYRQKFMSLQQTIEQWTKHYYAWLDEKNS